MKIKLKDLNNVIFYVAYFFFLLYAFFGTIDTFREPLKMLTNISMSMIFLSFFLQLRKYNAKEIVVLLLLLLLSLIYISKTDNFLLLKLILIIIVSKDVAFDKRISFDMKLRVVFLILMMLLYNLGIAKDVTALFNGKIRHSLGFSNPNVLGMHIFILCIDFLYLKRETLTFPNILFCIILFFLSNYYSGSRTIFLILILVIFMFLIYKYRKKFFEKNFIKFFIINSPFILAIVVLIAYNLYINNDSIGILINKVLSGRLLNIEFFSNNYTINLFGNNIAIAIKSLDTAIAYALYAFGISGILLYMFGFKFLLKKLYNIKNYPLLIITFTFIIYGLSEKLWLFADCNIFITALSLIIFKDDKLFFGNKKGTNYEKEVNKYNSTSL